MRENETTFIQIDQFYNAFTNSSDERSSFVIFYACDITPMGDPLFTSSKWKEKKQQKNVDTLNNIFKILFNRLHRFVFRLLLLLSAGCFAFRYTKHFVFNEKLQNFSHSLNFGIEFFLYFDCISLFKIVWFSWLNKICFLTNYYLYDLSVTCTSLLNTGSSTIMDEYHYG